MNPFDSQVIELECPQDNCSGKFKASIGKLRKSPTVRCPKCQSDIKVDASQFETALQSVEKRLKGFSKKINITLG